MVYSTTVKPRMEISSNADFGTVIANGKVLQKEIAILNRGSKNGTFKLVYEGNKAISMVPKQGVVKAGYSQPIRVCFFTVQLARIVIVLIMIR